MFRGTSGWPPLAGVSRCSSTSGQGLLWQITQSTLLLVIIKRKIESYWNIWYTISSIPANFYYFSIHTNNHVNCSISNDKNDKLILCCLYYHYKCALGEKKKVKELMHAKHLCWISCSTQLPEFSWALRMLICIKKLLPHELAKTEARQSTHTIFIYPPSDIIFFLKSSFVLWGRHNIAVEFQCA